MMTSKEYINSGINTPVKRSKYNAKKTIYNGHKYDSKKEANYAKKLDTLKQAGKIKDWIRQLRYKLIVNDIHVTTYVLDFKLFYHNGTVEHVDVKGMKKGAAYQTFKLKKKLMLAVHGIDVVEV